MSGERPYNPPEDSGNRRQVNPSYAPRYAGYNPDPLDARRQPRDRPKQRRRHSSDYGSSRRPKHVSKNESKPKEHSFSASVAGALAGGLIGHKAGKGDMFATAAGALVGAFGGGVAAEQHARGKNKSRDQDGDRSRRY
jgi:hypothetical protein